jgi:hypothetical protein
VYGSVAGTVRDASGAELSGATVTITSHERGTAVTVTTNASGFYVKGQILPGRYEVKAELRGFKSKVVSSVVVSVDTQTRVNLDLYVGDITEELVVEASEGQLLKTDRADFATTFERKRVTELPVLDRISPSSSSSSPARRRCSGSRTSPRTRSARTSRR